MKKLWHDEAWQEYEYRQMQDKKTLKKINHLIRDIERNGYGCTGRPKPLSGNYSGYWSVQIDEKNRIVFKIIDDSVLEIMQCGGHYMDT
jgi:toxin YoeB